MALKSTNKFTWLSLSDYWNHDYRKVQSPQLGYSQSQTITNIKCITSGTVVIDNILTFEPLIASKITNRYCTLWETNHHEIIYPLVNQHKLLKRFEKYHCYSWEKWKPHYLHWPIFSSKLGQSLPQGSDRHLLQATCARPWDSSSPSNCSPSPFAASRARRSAHWSTAPGTEPGAAKGAMGHGRDMEMKDDLKPS